MKVTPYTTESGLQIGCRYTPPPHTPTPEEISIQSVLLGDRQGDYSEAFAYIIAAVATVFVIACAIIKGLE